MKKLLTGLQSNGDNSKLHQHSNQLLSVVRDAYDKRIEVGEEEVHIVMRHRDEAVTRVSN